MHDPQKEAASGDPDAAFPGAVFFNSWRGVMIMNPAKIVALALQAAAAVIEEVLRKKK